MWIAVGAVVLPVSAFAYSKASPDGYTSTVHIRVISGNPDSLIQVFQVQPRRLAAYAALARTFRVAQAAAERTTPVPYKNKAAFLRAAAAIRRNVDVAVDVRTRELLLTARAQSPGAASRIASAYALGVLQVIGAQSVNLAAKAFTAIATRIARPPRGRAARRAEVASLRRFLLPVITEKQIQFARAESNSTSPLITAVVAAVISLLALLAMLLVTGVWRPRPATS